MAVAEFYGLWMFMVDIAIDNYSIPGVYKPTFTSLGGGHPPVVSQVRTAGGYAWPVGRGGFRRSSRIAWRLGVNRCFEALKIDV
jgi:hypothetical protein